MRLGRLSQRERVCHGELEAPVSLYPAAESAFERADMWLHAKSAQRRRGQLLGADEGQRLIADADTWMRQEKIVRPDRMAGMLAPGR